jgi:catalase
MLLGRMFAYPDPQRYRIGANYNQVPVNAPKSPVHSYNTAGQMRNQFATDPVYAPNSKGGPKADTARYGDPAGWHTDGDMVRTAYTLRAEDDDWGQAGTWSATSSTTPNGIAWWKTSSAAYSTA